LDARLGLFECIAKQRAFNQLRTIEALGYIVQTGLISMKNIFAFRVIVQSSDQPAYYLNSRVEAWLKSFREELVRLPEDEFETYRTSLIAKREEKPKTLNEESQRWWTEIILNTYKWDRGL